MLVQCFYLEASYLQEKHVQENLPIYPDDPAFFQQFTHVSGDEATPSTSKSTLELPYTEIIQQRAMAAKQFLEEESGQCPTFNCPSIEMLEPSYLETPK